jgi:hypothetical protein
MTDNLKKKLTEEGSKLSANIGQLKMASADWKNYLTDVAESGTSVTKNARLDIEKQGGAVISRKNVKTLGFQN